MGNLLKNMLQDAHTSVMLEIGADQRMESAREFKVRVRLAYDPKTMHCFLIQVFDDPKWKTMLTFNNEMLAKNAFALLKRHGTNLRVLEEAEVDG